MSKTDSSTFSDNGAVVLTKRRRLIASLISTIPFALMALLVIQSVAIFNGAPGWVSLLLGYAGVEITSSLMRSVAEYLCLFVILAVATMICQIAVGLYLFGFHGFKALRNK